MEVLLMKLTCAGTKKSPTYYIQKTIRIGNKTTTKTVERLGNIEESKRDVEIKILLNGQRNTQKTYYRRKRS